jgi:hypothetical protein
MYEDLPIKELVVMQMDAARAARLAAVQSELEPLGVSSEERMSLNDQLYARQELVKLSQGKQFESQAALDAYIAKCDKVIRLAWHAGIFAALGWLDEPEELLDRVLERNESRDHAAANEAFGDMIPPSGLGL